MPFRLLDLIGAINPWRLNNRITELEARMTTIEDVAARIDAATNQVAAELTAIRGELANRDQALADRLTPSIERLEALGADPANPVPDQPAPDQPPTA